MEIARAVSPLWTKLRNLRDRIDEALDDVGLPKSLKGSLTRQRKKIVEHMKKVKK